MPGFDGGYGCWLIRALKFSTAEARAICLRSIAVRIALRMDGIWPGVYSRLLLAAAAACRRAERCYCRTIRRAFYCRAFSRARGRRCRRSARWRGAGFPGRGRRWFVALCDKPETAQRVAGLAEQVSANQEGFVHICRLDTAGARVVG